jgi:hypothetical protein
MRGKSAGFARAKFGTPFLFRPRTFDQCLLAIPMRVMSRDQRKRSVPCKRIPKATPPQPHPDGTDEQTAKVSVQKSGGSTSSAVRFSKVRALLFFIMVLHSTSFQDGLRHRYLRPTQSEIPKSRGMNSPVGSVYRAGFCKAYPWTLSPSIRPSGSACRYLPVVGS